MDEEGDTDETAVVVGATELVTDELPRALPERVADAHADAVRDSVVQELRLAVGSNEVEAQTDAREVLVTDAQTEPGALMDGARE